MGDENLDGQVKGGWPGFGARANANAMTERNSILQVRSDIQKRGSAASCTSIVLVSKDKSDGSA